MDLSEEDFDDRRADEGEEMEVEVERPRRVVVLRFKDARMRRRFKRFVRSGER